MPRGQRMPTLEGSTCYTFGTHRPQIGRLFLEGNNITDAGAKKLAGMTQGGLTNPTNTP